MGDRLGKLSAVVQPAVAGKGEVENSYCNKDALVSAGLVLQLVHEQGNASALNLSVPLNWFIYAFFSISGLAFIVQYAEPWGCCHIRSTQTHDGCCHAIRARSRFLLPHQQPATFGHAVCVAQRGEGERLVLLGWLWGTDKLRVKAVGISTRYGPQTHEVEVNGTISLSLRYR